MKCDVIRSCQVLVLFGILMSGISVMVIGIRCIEVRVIVIVVGISFIFVDKVLVRIMIDGKVQMKLVIISVLVSVSLVFCVNFVNLMKVVVRMKVGMEIVVCELCSNQL